MSAKTRINRPNSSTPRKMPVRMFHQSTHFATIQTPTGPQTVKTKGTTYRKGQN